MSAREVTVQFVFNKGTVTQNTATTSVAIDLTHVSPNGVFALHILTQTGGTVDYTYSLCNTRNGTYITPAGATDIKAGNTTGSTGIYPFDPEVAKFMKIIATETNVSAVTVLTAEVAMQ